MLDSAGLSDGVVTLHNEGVGPKSAHGDIDASPCGTRKLLVVPAVFCFRTFSLDMAAPTSLQASSLQLSGLTQLWLVVCTCTCGQTIGKVLAATFILESGLYAKQIVKCSKKEPSAGYTQSVGAVGSVFVSLALAYSIASIKPIKP